MTDMELKEERRRNDTMVLDLMRRIENRVEQIEARLIAHINDEVQQIRDVMIDAFPEGDTRAHREAHKAWIQELNDRRELRKKIIEKLATGGAWGTILAIIALGWYWLKGHL